MMRPVFLLFALLLFSVVTVPIMTVPVMAEDQWVPGHYRSDGTWVPGYWRTKPNTTDRDNYTTSPNTNPYTQNPGRKKHDVGEDDRDPFGKPKYKTNDRDDEDDRDPGFGPQPAKKKEKCVTRSILNPCPPE
jgi:hypothetical protein